MAVSFVHLRLHTEYSLEDSIVSIKTLAAKAKELKLPALALTDQMNLFAAVKFYRAMQNAGIKPIIGADISLTNPQMSHQPFRCTLLCQNQKGYQNLMELISKAYLEHSKTGPVVVEPKWLSGNTEGLIALSGGTQGELGRLLIEKKTETAIHTLNSWKKLFPDRFYIELQRMGQTYEESYIKEASHLAEVHQVPLVATHDIRFLTQDDFDAHEARVCIQHGLTLNDTKRPKVYTIEQYLKSIPAMEQRFADIPSALDNSVEIAKRCNLQLSFNQVHLPNFSLPNQTTAENYLIQKAQEGLKERLAQSQNTSQAIEIPKEPTALIISRDKQANEDESKYYKRLQSELTVINDMGFASYFLIVADFIQWAKTQQIPVGPGRGSGAGSLVAYALKITDLDPLEYDLLFERFLNPERISLPDFDIDFCMENRDQVINYVMERYGRKAVAQIITFGTMAARAVIRDVGRVLGYPYGMVDKIAKLVPFEVGITLEKALNRDINFHQSLKARYDQEDAVKILIDLARKLEGLVRNAGTHAGGIVIAPSHLTNFTALYYDVETHHGITQFDKDDLETIGLVKFDFLGLRTLTIIDWAVNMINEKRRSRNEALLDIHRLALNDAATFKLLRSGQVKAVFQLESRGIQNLLKRLTPDHFADIVALLALFRPGPLQSGMVDDFIQRKHNRSLIRYPHPLLESILQETYGVIVYQEQVMQIARTLANYTLGAADLLRRAMGKKKPAEMAKQRIFFMEGAEKKGIEKAFANSMFDLIEKFAGYGFNKSHSVAYALLSYQTAWLKAHYPTEFMAAVLSSELEHTEKLASLIYECRTLDVKINSPSIHDSQYVFTVSQDNHIEYGLGAIKGLGKAAIEHLIAVQAKSGLFQNLFDLCSRVDLNKVTRQTLKALIYSGSLDCLGTSRAVLHEQLNPILRAALQYSQTQSSQQSDLFGGIHKQMITPILNIGNAVVWSLVEECQYEKITLGLYFNKHPIQQYQAELSCLILVSLSEIDTFSVSAFIVAAWLVSFQVKFTSRGDSFVILLLEDGYCRKELKLSQHVYQTVRESLVKDALFVFEIETYKDKVTNDVRSTVKQVWDIAQTRQQWGRYMMIVIPPSLAQKNLDYLNTLESTLHLALGGQCTVMLQYHTAQAQAQLKLGDHWRVKPTDQLIAALQEVFGKENVWLKYR